MSGQNMIGGASASKDPFLASLFNLFARHLGSSSSTLESELALSVGLAGSQGLFEGLAGS